MTSDEQISRKIKIDPRIRKRRNEVAKSQARKRLYVILAILSFLILVLIVRLLLGTSLFGVKKFIVLGANHYGKITLEGQTGIVIGTPLLNVNVAKVEQNLNSYPWNEHALVTKHWPNTIEIRVQSRKPVALIPSNKSQDILVARSGVVLQSMASNNIANRIVLCVMPSIGSSKALSITSSCSQQSVATGSKVSTHFSSLLKVASSVPKALDGKIVELAAGSNGEIDGKLSSGIAVRFGSIASLASKFRALELILSQASTKGYSTIDVRVPEEPVLSNW